MNISFTLSVALLFFASLSCLAQAQAPTPAPKPATGLEGNIFLHSVSGGPVKKGVPDSIPLANMTFIVQQQDRVVSTFTTDLHGQFQVPLPPGHYTVTRKDWKSHVGFFGPFEVDVTTGPMKSVHWNCDTGMQ